MKILQYLLCIFISNVFGENEAVNDESARGRGELKLVFTIFRHGDRSPMVIYPHDANKIDNWPKGLGELTNLGRRNAYNLGQYFWNRYGQELNLSSVFTNNSPEVHITSTAIQRAKMSAVYFLAGFYKENVTVVMKSEEMYERRYNVPFTAEAEDQLLSMTPCPKKAQLQTKWQDSSDEYKAFIKHNDDLLHVFYSSAGTKDYNTIVDAIYCEMSHNLSQPQWVVKNIHPIMEYWDTSKKYETPITELKRIAAGPLIAKLVKVIDEKIHKDNDPPKMYIFSAHDANIISLLSALACFNNRQPPYSSAVIIELRQLEQLYYIQILFHNDSRSEPYVFNVPGCSKVKCLFSEFRHQVMNVMFSEIDRERYCGWEHKSNSLKLSDNVIPIAICVVIVVGAVLAFIMFRVFKRKRKPKGDPMMYQPLAYCEDDDEDI